MKINQILPQEITNSELWLSREKEESIYKRDLKKRIELINWVLENMKNPNAHICSLIESRMNETIQGINKTDSIFQADKLHSELRILDWILIFKPVKDFFIHANKPPYKMFGIIGVKLKIQDRDSVFTSNAF